MFLIVFLLITIPAFTQERGDSAIAARYVQWVQAALREEQYEKAALALERALDFADSSSDISYLYALMLSHQEKPQGAILKATRQALETGLWTLYNKEQARLLEIEVLVRLRLFSYALQSLQYVYQSADSSYLRLRALKNTNIQEFKTSLLEALERYPRDARFVRLFLEYASDRLPEHSDTDVLSQLIMKAPFLLDSDPALAYLIAPFINDTDTARQFITEYRQKNKADIASFPITLALGIVDDMQIIEELSSHDNIDKRLLDDVWNTLRSNEARSFMKECFASFSGVLTEDPDKDGYVNFVTVYDKGRIVSLEDDFNQDGLADHIISFESGIPHHAQVTFASDSDTVFAFPTNDEERQKMVLRWEKYPALFDANVKDAYYLLRPLTLFFVPVSIQEGAAGVLYPERNTTFELSTRALTVSSIFIERKSTEFDGALERIELDYGIPRLAREYIGEKIVSETTFDNGKALNQKVDLDGDGYFETIRYFRLISEGAVSKTLIQSWATDWNTDGIFEGREFWKIE